MFETMHPYSLAGENKVAFEGQFSTFVFIQCATAVIGLLIDKFSRNTEQYQWTLYVCVLGYNILYNS